MAAVFSGGTLNRKHFEKSKVLLKITCKFALIQNINLS
jgi:hypothetical protein